MQRAHDLHGHGVVLTRIDDRRGRRGGRILGDGRGRLGRRGQQRGVQIHIDLADIALVVCAHLDGAHSVAVEVVFVVLLVHVTGEGGEIHGEVIAGAHLVGDGAAQAVGIHLGVAAVAALGHLDVSAAHLSGKIREGLEAVAKALTVLVGFHVGLAVGDSHHHVKEHVVLLAQGQAVVKAEIIFGVAADIRIGNDKDGIEQRIACGRVRRILEGGEDCLVDAGGGGILLQGDFGHVVARIGHGHVFHNIRAAVAGKNEHDALAGVGVGQIEGDDILNVLLFDIVRSEVVLGGIHDDDVADIACGNAAGSQLNVCFAGGKDDVVFLYVHAAACAVQHAHLEIHVRLFARRVYAADAHAGEGRGGQRALADAEQGEQQRS